MSEEQQTSSAETDTPAEVGAKTRPSPQYLRFQLLINGQDPAEKVRQREARVNTSSESNDPLREALEWDAWVHLTAPNPIMHNDLMSIVYHNNIVKWKEFAAIAPDFKAMDSWTYPQDLTHKMTPETFERLKEQMKSTFEPALTLDPTLLPEYRHDPALLQFITRYVGRLSAKYDTVGGLIDNLAKLWIFDYNGLVRHKDAVIPLLPVGYRNRLRKAFEKQNENDRSNPNLSPVTEEDGNEELSVFAQSILQLEKEILASGDQIDPKTKKPIPNIAKDPELQKKLYDMKAKAEVEPRNPSRKRRKTASTDADA
eukprot:TRINITY_DN4837_c0_g1_i2.p1 TRINITY_DN4837_c0_g1~~TRINITY_DN4837_c0_g1_i2.p1  ORF type:complete len:313 (+),score=20.05 TRINITY_DN4837_c0_g1_i2:269-1207(+)